MSVYKGWVLTYKNPGKVKYKNLPERIEATRTFGDTSVMIRIGYYRSMISMNGTAKIDSFQLRDMSDVVGYCQDLIHKGLRP